MAIRTYIEDGKKYFEIYVNGQNSKGVRIQRKRRGVETLRKAQTLEFDLQRELAELREEGISYRWSEWFEECLKRIKTSNSFSTFEDYDKQLRKWVSPKFDALELKKITKMMVHTLIFEDLDPKLSPHTKRKILKMIRRVFQMAVEDGILDRNPTTGIQFRVPEVEQSVLTNTEVEIFLQQEIGRAHV